MKVIAKRVRILAIVCIVAAIVIVISGIALLNVTDDGSTTIPAIVLFSISGFLFLLALINLFIKPNKILLYDDIKNELLIRRKGAKLSFPIEIPISDDSKYFVIPICNIISTKGINKPEGSSSSFGAVGYLATTKNINRLEIEFIYQTNTYNGIVNNLNNVEEAASFIIYQRNKIINENNK